LLHEGCDLEEHEDMHFDLVYRPTPRRCPLSGAGSVQRGRVGAEVGASRI
jgi:hypothetical protein